MVSIFSAKAEQDENNNDFEPTEDAFTDNSDRREQLMTEHNVKIMQMGPEQQERREEMMMERDHMMGSHKPMMAPEQMVRRREMMNAHRKMMENNMGRMMSNNMEHHNEIMNEQEQYKNMIGRPSEEESPNPGEPVIP